MTSKSYPLLALAILSALVGAGCASVSTRGSLPAVESYGELPKAKKSITVRFYARTDYRMGKNDEYGSSTLENPEGFGELVRQNFAQSGAFSDVRVEEFSARRISFRSKSDEIAKKLIAESLTRIKTDYFFDIVDHSTEEVSGMHWNIALCLPAILTVGIVPCPKPFQTNLEGTLYDQNGKVLGTYHVADRATIWGWSPLIVWPGAKIFAENRAVAQNVVLKAVQNLLKELLQGGRVQ